MNRNRALLAAAVCVTLSFAPASAQVVVAKPVPPCGDGSTGAPALDQLKGAAASGDMSAVTGDGCPQTPTAPSSGQPAPTIPTTPPAKPQPPANVPSVTDQQPEKSGGGFFSGLKKTVKGLPVNQALAGVGFGAAIGMLLAFGGPLGMIGGALIGGVIGGILGSGIIGKLMGHGGTGNS